MADRYQDWDDYPKQLDEQGRWLCRWCGKVLSGRRTSWCSKECEQQVEIRCGHGVRAQVWKRDHGVCSRCGRDTKTLEHRLKQLRKVSMLLYADEIRELDITPAEAMKSLWQAHHKKSVKEGGGGCGLDGFETVCLWCHKEEHRKK